MTDRLGSDTHDTSTEQRVHAIPANGTELKVLELSRQKSLDVLGVDGEEVCAAQVADRKGGDVAVLLFTDHVDALLSQLWYQILLVGRQRLFQVVDPEGILAGIQWHAATAQTFGMARLLPRVHDHTNDLQHNGRGRETQNERRRHFSG